MFRIDIDFHILSHIEEQAKSKTVVIAIHSIVTALARGLGLIDVLPLMPILHEGWHLNLASLCECGYLTVVGGKV